MNLTERTKAEEVRSRYLASQQRLLADNDLTDDARRRRLADEWVKATNELAELREADADRLARRERDLERQLFGLPNREGAADAISSRDAADRAGSLSAPDEAARSLAQAEQNGDKVLAQAIARHAVRMSRVALTREASKAWDDVTAAFLDVRPTLMPLVEELAEIERLTSRQVFSPFSLAQPPGVLPADINQARSAAA